jgi:hypothetical protein
MGAVAVLAGAITGCGEAEPELQDRLLEIQEEIERAEPSRRDLDRRLTCRDRHTGDPPAIQACIDRQ